MIRVEACRIAFATMWCRNSVRFTSEGKNGPTGFAGDPGVLRASRVRAEASALVVCAGGVPDHRRRICGGDRESEIYVLRVRHHAGSRAHPNPQSQTCSGRDDWESAAGESPCAM